MASQELNSPVARSQHDRSFSMSSSNPTSVTGHANILAPPLIITPDPMYIAASAASQIVTNDHESQSHLWFDQHGIEPSGETALVAPPALKLINNFLDQLLFNFLSVARSTSLASLRPAVGEVLKPKLARDAIGLADQELQEYLGGGEDEELLAFHNGLEPVGDWDLELVWKRTRLRCMVYSSLGDMEEEDEDLYAEQENLDGPASSQFSASSGIVSPAVAIFLTSILEFMGEQALIVAGQAAYHRLQAKHEKDERDGTTTPHDIADRVVVDDMDMERVALDRTLGRLWRGWKKRIRAPTVDSISRPFSRESIRSRGNSRRGSLGNEAPLPVIIAPQHNRSSLSAVTPNGDPCTIPLPMGDNDIREIEIPGVAAEIDSDASAYSSDEEEPQPKRPKSWVLFTRNVKQVSTPRSSRPQSLEFPKTSLKRSNSVPLPAKSQTGSSSKKRKSRRNSAITQETPAVTTEEQTEGSTEGKATQEELSEKATEKDPADEATDKAADEEPAHEQPAERAMTEAPVAAIVEEEDKSDPTEAQSDPTVLEESTTLDNTPAETSAKESVAEAVHEEVPKTDGLHHKGLVAGVVAGATAIGIAAVVGIKAKANGDAPRSKIATDVDSDLDDEEAEIMTSSRISVQGRTSPDLPEGSKSSSVRPHSVHSVRLVAVHSPSRSRHGSIDLGAVSSSSLKTPNLQDDGSSSPISRTGNSSPLARNSSAMSNRQLKNSTEKPISEMEEPSQAKESIRTTSITLPERSPLREIGPSSPIFSSDLAQPSPTQESQIPATPTKIPDPSFILAAAPLTRVTDGLSSPHHPQTPSYTPFGSLQTSQITVPTSSSTLKPAGLENGAPPLTPLREMMEGAPDTSDEASSIAPSDGRSISDAHGRSISDTQGASFILAGNSSPVDRKVSQGMYPERSLSGSGASPQQVSREEDITPRPETRGRAQRHIHTSGSSSSSNTSHKIKVHRTSEESMPGGADKSQSFEQLIHSDQTIQYTLTPQNIRQIEPQGQRPVSGLSPVPVYANGLDFKSPSQSYQSPLNKFAGLSSNPPKRAVSSSMADPSRKVSSPNSSMRVRPLAQQARDARVDRQSLGDFAEFIRTTGPPGSTEIASGRISSMSNGYAPVVNGHTSVVNGNRGVNGTARGSVASARSGATAITSDYGRSNPSSNRVRLIARDPVVPQHDNTSELIDFIRQGPPKSSANDTPRIPRNVAPFRTTADSDQMSGAVGARLTDSQNIRNSVASTAFSTEPLSMHSSMHSQSALLNSFKSEYKPDSRDVRESKPAKTSTVKQVTDYDDDEMIPKRKQRRVKDPYAIDLSDEDDEITDFAPRPKRQEESLIDFLNNVPPPESMTSSVGKNPQPISKRPSGAGLINGFRSNTVAPNGPIPKASSSRSSSRNSVISSQTQPHIPNGTKYSDAKSSSVNSRRGTYVSQLDTERNPKSRVAQQQFQPREAVASAPHARTNDLADFLMNTTPPPPSIQSRAHSALSSREIPKEKEGFSRMFGRKKKIAA